MSSRPSGLRCRPSCAQVKTSNSSSNVPIPPGSATNASERSAISALRSCIEATTRRSGRPSWPISGAKLCWGGALGADLEVEDLLGDDADDLAPGLERSGGDSAHHAVLAAAVDEAHAAL